MKLKKPCFGEIKKALASRGEGLIELNVGLDPREGKYHATACNACFARFSAEDAKRFDWKCPKCRGQIKKGVKDRILELASFSQEIHPEFRPEYFHAIPLAEIVQKRLKASATAGCTTFLAAAETMESQSSAIQGKSLKPKSWNSKGRKKVLA